jgi:competence ComEA-like helix-hairpin-helix protein
MNHGRQNSVQSFAFVISICVAAGFCRGFVSNLRIADSAPGQREIELESRINPNVAPVESLVRLPGVGLSRAVSIVAYRESLNRTKGIKPAFENCDDLQKIDGIGPKTASEISEWMKFE